MRRAAALAAVLIALLLLVIAQVVLPGIATDHLRDRLARSGQVLHVEVHAFPAIELLWGHADRVVVRLGRYQPHSSHLPSLLNQTANVGTLDASATELDEGLLTLRNVTLQKHGNVLTGTAQITEADLRASLPILQSVTPVASGNGQLVLRGTASLFGLTATVNATVAALNGNIIVQPDVPFGGLVRITVFSDPHVYVQDVSATAVPGGFSVSARATLH